MAQTATVYNFEISLSNVDSGIYEQINMPVARHPSETLPYLMTRVLAYCLEFQEGITFTKGLSESEEPAIWACDLTGQLKLWVDIGAPSANRLHKASKLGVQVAVYAHKNPSQLVSDLQKEQIYAAEKIRIYTFRAGFLDELCSQVEKRNKLSISVSEGHIYVQIREQQIDSPLLSLHLVLN